MVITAWNAYLLTMRLGIQLIAGLLCALLSAQPVLASQVWPIPRVAVPTAGMFQRQALAGAQLVFPLHALLERVSATRRHDWTNGIVSKVKPHAVVRSTLLRLGFGVIGLGLASHFFDFTLFFIAMGVMAIGADPFKTFENSLPSQSQHSAIFLSTFLIAEEDGWVSRSLLKGRWLNLGLESKSSMPFMESLEAENLTTDLFKSGVDIYGVSPLLNKESALDGSPRFIGGLAQQLPLLDESFEVVTSVGLWNWEYAFFSTFKKDFKEKTADVYRSMAREAFRVLVPGGLIIANIGSMENPEFIKAFEEAGFITRVYSHDPGNVRYCHPV